MRRVWERPGRGAWRGCSTALAAGLCLVAAPIEGQQATEAGPEGPSEARLSGPLPRIGPAAGPIGGADSLRQAAETDRKSLESRPVGPALLRRSDLPYALTFFGSLALVEPLSGFERAVVSAGDGDGAGPDQLVYEAGAWAGNLWIDLGAAAATWGVGELVGDRKVARVGLRSLETLAAVDLLTTLFKVGVGRRRPGGTTEPDVFRPIAWSSEFASFPSGHTSHAFALAETLSRELGGWAPWVAYPLATGVGASRVIGRHHWPTDIVAGAALGVFTARMVGRLHRSGDTSAFESLTVVPGPGPGILVGATLPAR